MGKMVLSGLALLVLVVIGVVGVILLFLSLFLFISKDKGEEGVEPVDEQSFLLYRIVFGIGLFGFGIAFVYFAFSIGITVINQLI